MQHFKLVGSLIFTSILLLLTGLLIGCRDRLNYQLISDLTYSTYTHNDHTEPLLLDLCIPKTKSSSSLPLIIYLHDGGWWAKSKAECSQEMITDRGYILACINYHLSNIALFPAQ
jgi:acetyl esterase/lipase